MFRSNNNLIFFAKVNIFYEECIQKIINAIYIYIYMEIATILSDKV